MQVQQLLWILTLTEYNMTPKDKLKGFIRTVYSLGQIDGIDMAVNGEELVKKRYTDTIEIKYKQLKDILAGKEVKIYGEQYDT